MASIKCRDTKPELFIRKALFARGFRYRIAPKYIPGHPDIYLAKYNIAIFIHGCFWHRHSGCKLAYTPKSNIEFWNKKFLSNKKRDQIVRAELKEQGVRCMIIWECAIKAVQKSNADREKFFSRIEEAIKSSTSFIEIDSHFVK